MSSLGDRLNAARRVHGPDDAPETDETSELPAAPPEPLGLADDGAADFDDDPLTSPSYAIHSAGPQSPSHASVAAAAAAAPATTPAGPTLGAGKSDPAGFGEAGRRSIGSQQDRLEDIKQAVHAELLKQLGPKLYASDMDANELDRQVRTVLVRRAVPPGEAAQQQRPAC